MNLNQFTVKAQEAVVDAQATAVKRNNQSVDPEHLLSALIKQDESLVAQCLDKMQAGLAKVLAGDVEAELAKKPEVHGNVQPYMSAQANRLLVQSEDESKALKDDFISTEHLFLAFFTLKDGNLPELFRQRKITKAAFLEALQKVRGNQRVTDQNPEQKYNALER